MAERPFSVHNLITLLQECRGSKCRAHARLLHACLCQHHLESHQVLGNYLVPMLVDCGSLTDAHYVFNALPFRNEVSWNCLILGYIDCGEPQHAFLLYHGMIEDHVHPNSYTFGALLKACSRLKDLERSHALSTDITKKGLERDPFIGNALVDMYVACSSFAEARVVLEELADCNAVSWTVLMAGYAEQGLGDEALACFEQMQLKGVAPDSVTLLCSLKACGVVGVTEKGKGLHAEIIKKGVENDVSIGNSLVDMYGKCGLLTEARQVFNTLPVRALISWNALIARYDDHGLCEEANSCFKEMQFKGVAPDYVTVVSSLKACCNLGAIGWSRDMHTEAIIKGFETNLSVGNTLIDMYSKFGLVAEARQVFEKLPARDSVSWNALIVGYAENSFGKEALLCFELMQLAGICPDSVTLVCILKLCGSMRALERGRVLRAKIASQGLGRDLFVGRMLVDMFAKCGSLAEAQEVFDSLPVRDAVSWTALITGYTEHGHSEQALDVFESMQLGGVAPDVVTFLCGLKACGSVKALGKGHQICADIVKKGLDSDLFVGSTLVDMYAKCGLFVEAQKVFDQLPVRNVVAWTALIAGYADNGLNDEAFKCFEQMQRVGVSPDSSTFVCSLKACGNLGYLEKGRTLRAEIAQKGWERDQLVGNALVDMFAKCGSLAEAHEVFNKLLVHNVITWNALISGYAELGLGKEAISCFEQMQQEEVSPDNVTFLCTLKACSSIGAMEKGQLVLAIMIELGLDLDLSIANTLIDMFGKCGFLMEAQRLFDKLPVQDVVSWNALITGYVENGFTEEALKCFNQMQSEAKCPDVVTFGSSLKACSMIGDSERGQEIHAEIIKKGLFEVWYVGNTLVDMYAKCRMLAEAKEVFGMLQLQDSVSWAALIAGYAEIGYDEEILNCFEQMQVKDVSADNVTLVHCLKSCARRGALEVGREIHAEIRKLGLEKDRYVGNMLIDMYGKCGSLEEGREVFDKLPVRDIVSWNAMIKIYGENHEGNMAILCFEEMQEHGVKPDGITFVCLLVACSHASLVLKGQEYFKMMVELHGIVPTIYHYLCLVDLLARSGQVYEAEKFAETLQGPMSKEVLIALLSACKIYGKVEVGLRCFQQLVQVNQEDAAAHLLMAEVYVSTGRCNDASRIEELRKHVGATKKPASALVEVNKTLHEFMVDDNKRKDLSTMLENLGLRMKDVGYMPNLDLLVRRVRNEEKEVSEYA